jgi:recombinational DNA repair protein RecR
MGYNTCKECGAAHDSSIPHVCSDKRNNSVIKIRLKDNIDARVSMTGYSDEEHQVMLKLMHDINNKHQKDDWKELDK